MYVKELIKRYHTERKSSQEQDRYEKKQDKARRKRQEDAYLADLEFEHITAQREWISDHMEEECRGVAILQRIERLDNSVGNDGSVLHVEGTSNFKSGPLTSAEKAGLLHEVIENNRRVAEHWKTMPLGNTARAYEIDCTNREPASGRRAQWYHERGVCAELGGCCGRKCGCCEKPVTKYIVSSEGGKKSVPIYGHCTVECACCIKERGRYVPDPRLPDVGARAC